MRAMRRQRGAAAAAAAALLLAVATMHLAVTPAQAIVCSPGQGVLNNPLLKLLGLGSSEPQCASCNWMSVSSGGDDAACVTCAGGGLSAPNALKTECDCLPGSYVGAPAEGASPLVKNCVACGATAVSTERNAAQCTQCPSGAVATRANTCACPAGWRATGFDAQQGVLGCEQCPEGQVSPGGQSTTCEACPAGALALDDASACGCPAGWRVNSTAPLTCERCASVFEYTTEASRLAMCRQCLPFSYANQDHTACECAAGYYTFRQAGGTVNCQACPPGTFKAKAGNGPEEACEACPEGLVPSGSRRSCVEPACPMGTERAADGSCEQCADGTYNARRGGTCAKCEGNTLSNPERTRCDACAEGHVQTSETGEDLRCLACMPGYTLDVSTSSCKPE